MPEPSKWGTDTVLLTLTPEGAQHFERLEAEAERLRTRLRETTEAIRVYVEVGAENVRDDWLTEEIELNREAFAAET